MRYSDKRSVVGGGDGRVGGPRKGPKDKAVTKHFYTVTPFLLKSLAKYFCDVTPRPVKSGRFVHS